MIIIVILTGPEQEYRRLGITQLYLPTVDHFEPSLEAYYQALQFIKSCKERGVSVYLHCRAGHGKYLG